MGVNFHLVGNHKLNVKSAQSLRTDLEQRLNAEILIGDENEEPKSKKQHYTVIYNDCSFESITSNELDKVEIIKYELEDYNPNKILNELPKDFNQELSIYGDIHKDYAILFFNNYYSTRTAYYYSAFEKPEKDSEAFENPFLINYLLFQVENYRKIGATEMFLVSDLNFEITNYIGLDFEELKKGIYKIKDNPIIDFFEFVNNKSYREANYRKYDDDIFIVHFKL